MCEPTPMRKVRRLTSHRRLPRQPLSPQQRQRARLLAFLATILVCAALIFRGIGSYRARKAVGLMNFGGLDSEQEVTRALGVFTHALAEAGDMMGLGNLVLLVGGAMLTYVWTIGRFRERWFSRATLVFSLLLFWQPLVGTFFGLLWFWLLFWDRKQFSVQQAILVAE